MAIWVVVSFVGTSNQKLSRLPPLQRSGECVGDCRRVGTGDNPKPGTKVSDADESMWFGDVWWTKVQSQTYCMGVEY